MVWSRNRNCFWGFRLQENRSSFFFFVFSLRKSHNFWLHLTWGDRSGWSRHISYQRTFFRFLRSDFCDLVLGLHFDKGIDFCPNFFAFFLSNLDQFQPASDLSCLKDPAFALGQVLVLTCLTLKWNLLRFDEKFWLFKNQIPNTFFWSCLRQGFIIVSIF